MALNNLAFWKNVLRLRKLNKIKYLSIKYRKNKLNSIGK